MPMNHTDMQRNSRLLRESSGRMRNCSRLFPGVLPQSRSSGYSMNIQAKPIAASNSKGLAAPKAAIGLIICRDLSQAMASVALMASRKRSIMRAK